jgi:hypothetical protein
MNAKPGFAPGFAPSRASLITSITVLAGVCAAAVLAAVLLLFQSRGEPMENLAAAERECVQQAYQSSQQACMDELLAVWRAGPTVV